jgi:hypothetical protein
MLPAFVVSVVAEGASPLISEAAGCVLDGTPDVEIVLIHWCVVAASDSTPPSVEALGFGSRAAGSVPEPMFEAFVVSVVAEGASDAVAAFALSCV